MEYIAPLPERQGYGLLKLAEAEPGSKPIPGLCSVPLSQAEGIADHCWQLQE
jgi:hypothetical protein